MKNTKKSISVKNLILTTFFALALVGFTHAQSGSGFGLKGGLNYSANGDYFESIGEAAQDPDRNVGYHIGVFGKIGDRIYLRPELMYTNTRSDYDDDALRIKKLDAPILVGAKILGPVSVFAGPAFQYIMDSEFDGITIDNVENDFSVGLNFGVGLSLNKIGLDLRYERGFSENEATFIGNNLGEGAVSRVDTRPDQLILSLSVAF